MGESMKDYEELLEKSYSFMGDGVHDTDSLLAWRKAEELKASQKNIMVTVSEVVKGGVVADFEGLRAFIPISKLSLERIDDCDAFLGKELEVRPIMLGQNSAILGLKFTQFLCTLRIWLVTHGKFCTDFLRDREFFTQSTLFNVIDHIVIILVHKILQFKHC